MIDTAINDRILRDHADRADIIQLKNLYGHLIDGIICGRIAKDGTAIGALFTEDAVVDLSSSGFYGVHTGRDEIIQLFLEKMANANRWMWHSFHNPIVEIDGDRAVGRWTIYAQFLMRDLEQPVPFFGRYDDTFIKVDGAWRHSHLKLLTENVTG